jgi:Tol biopolymer transport system component
VYLLDARQGDLQKLELDQDVFSNSPQFALSGGGKRWMLVGSPRMDHTFLLDLESGQTYNLTDLEANLIYYGLFAPDEKHLLLSSQDLWLVPSDKPGRARRLGTGQTTFANSFSSDGKKVAYFQRSEDDEFEVVVEDVDGSQSKSFAFDERIIGLTFVPQKEQLLLAQSEATSLLSLDDGQVQELLAFSGRLAGRLWLAPDGKRFLLNTETDDEVVLWHLVDLEGGQAQLLDELQGYSVYLRDLDHRWLFFVDDPGYGVGGRNFMALDLETGETRQAIELDAETRYMGLPAVSVDGKFGLVSAYTQDKKSQLWLIRADGGEPRLLAEAAGAEGSFSPDGKWVAVGTAERVDERTETQITLMETDGEETRSLGQGFRPVWVRP